MSDVRFDLERYLERVGLASRPRADESGLRALHEAQFSTIPFENFDIQLDRGIDLDPAHLFDKLVVRPRGGYCFELNGLMLMALRAVGFEARPLLARVHLGPTPSGPTHQLNLVQLRGQPWVIDVGFGAGGLRTPMPLEIGRTEEHAVAAFRFEQREPWGYMLCTCEQGAWKDSYSFGLGHVTDADIAVGNHFTSTSRESHFTQHRIASMPRASGRVSIYDFTVTEIHNNVTATHTVDAASYLDTLKEHFNIALDADYAKLRQVDVRPNSQ